MGDGQFVSNTDAHTLVGCKVLIVEDHPQSLELLCIYVSSLAGVEVLSATDGPTGAKLAETDHPDLILLDVMMPGMSGFEVCRRLKEQPSTRDIVVVMVTALDAPADLERAADCHADEYIAKPFDRGVLLERIRRLLIAQKHRRRPEF